MPAARLSMSSSSLRASSRSATSRSALSSACCAVCEASRASAARRPASASGVEAGWSSASPLALRRVALAAVSSSAWVSIRDLGRGEVLLRHDRGLERLRRLEPLQRQRLAERRARLALGRALALLAGRRGVQVALRPDEGLPRQGVGLLGGLQGGREAVPLGRSSLHCPLERPRDPQVLRDGGAEFRGPPPLFGHAAGGRALDLVAIGHPPLGRLEALPAGGQQLGWIGRRRDGLRQRLARRCARVCGLQRLHGREVVCDLPPQAVCPRSGGGDLRLGVAQLLLGPVLGVAGRLQAGVRLVQRSLVDEVIVAVRRRRVRSWIRTPGTARRSRVRVR